MKWFDDKSFEMANLWFIITPKGLFFFFFLHYHSPNLINSLSFGQSAKLTDRVLNIHSAYQLITTEWYNQKINEPFDQSQYSIIQSCQFWLPFISMM